MLTEKLSILLAKMRFHARKLRLGIGAGDLVLDIGAGHAPHFRADVACDISLGDDRERCGPVNLDRPFVVGDAECLPFRDKAFDFIICTHLLEHLHHPERCFQEMLRVGKRGYIETPSEFAEKLCGWPPHRWFVRCENGRLIFTQKTRPIYDETIASGTWQAWDRGDPAYHLFFWRNPELFFATYPWEGEIAYSIQPAERVENELFIDAEPGVRGGSPLRTLRGWCRFDPGWENLLRHIVVSFLRLRNCKRIDLLQIIACPICKSGLHRQGERLVCLPCRKWYPMWGEVPVLLSSEAHPLERESAKVAG
jgi:uncharacterized protein YbaR (Trm112 family)